MKKAKEIIENKLEDELDFFNDELKKFNKIKENFNWYSNTQPPPDEEDKKVFLEKKEKYKLEFEENKKNMDIYRKEMGGVYRELIKNLKNNLEEHDILDKKNKEDRGNIINHIEEYLEEIKKISLKIEELREDVFNSNNSNNSTNISSLINKEPANNTNLNYIPIINKVNLDRYEKFSSKFPYVSMIDHNKKFFMDLAEKHKNNFEDFYNELILNHGLRFNYDYKNLTKEERMKKLRDLMNKHLESPYRLKSQAKRLKILINKPDNSTVDFSSDNSASNIIEWIKYVGPEIIMQHNHLFNDYFNLKEEKKGDEFLHVINFKNKYYYLYLKHCSNESRENYLKKIMQRIHGDDFTIFLE